MGYPQFNGAPNPEPGRARYLCISGYGGNAGSGTWMQFFATNPSNASPLIFSEDSTIRAFSASCNTSTTVTFGIYVNASQVDTLVITSSTWGLKVDIEHLVSAGDQLSIKVESGSAKDPVFFCHVRVDI